jgi:hypothetical protein
MTQIIATIDGLHGTVKIDIDGDDKDRQTLTFNWCGFDDYNDKTGFLTSFNDAPIILTETAAEQFLRMIMAALIRSLDIQPGQVTILNHLGEKLSDVEFLPPTFEGNEADLVHFVAAQDSLRGIFGVYEQTGELSPDAISACQDEGILEDFLCLVQVRASGLQLAVRKPDTEE